MRCVVGMSGGVDSSTSAYLMKKKGYEVIGCTLKLFNNEKAEASIKDAVNIADFLEIPIEIIDCTEDFQKYVIDYFITYYRNGQTPSPCIMCNEFIKFKYLNEFRNKHNADLLVTGHYARIIRNEGIAELHQGTDPHRDQAYFLYGVNGETLSHTEFPLGNNTKAQTRAIAKDVGIPVADKPDSQDICFIQNNDYISFIKEHLKEQFEFKNGNIVDINGKILGQHNGIINYTIGQRRGLGLSGGPFFVSRIDVAKNEVIVSDKEGVKVHKLYLNNTKFINEPFEGECEVKIRSNGNKIRATIKNEINELPDSDNNIWSVTLIGTEYGAAQGQHCVFFKEDQVLGGGEIK